MTNLFDQGRIGGRIARASALCLLAVAAALLQAGEAQAQWTTSGTNNTTTNNVGIGTTAPGTSLHVSTGAGAGTVRGIINEQTSADSNSALFFFRKSRDGAAAQNGDNVGSLFASGFDGAGFVNSARMRFAIDGPVAAGSMPIGLQFMTGASGEGVERMRITSAGNVGIGTAAPVGKFDLATTGSANIGGVDFVVRDSVAANSNPIVFSHKVGTASGSLSRIGFNVYSTGSFALLNPSVGGWAIQSDTRNGITAPALQFTSFDTVPNKIDIMTLQQGGNVGIGTATPAYLLDIAGSTSTPLRVRDSAGREYFSTSTRTGPNPAWVGPVASLAGNRLIVDSTSPDGNNDTLIRRMVNSLIFNPSDHPTLPGAFMVRQVGGYAGLFVDQNTNGNVGIGTTAPASKLHVAGNITVDGNISAKYQDVAEWVPSAQKLAAGTVVVLDTGRDNHVLASHSAYDTRVAGVISAQPGLSLGEAGEGKVLVATTGRVKVRVDAARGAIKIGDLIVTSEVPGVAMRSEPVLVGGVAMHRPGTLIGKALQSLDKGTGEILVLLSLQ